MNLGKIWEYFAPVVVALPILVLVVFYLLNKFSKRQKPPDYAKIHVRIGDDATFFLERKKFWGKWYYAIEADKFPVVWKSPEESYRELAKTMKALEEPMRKMSKRTEEKI